MTDPYVEMEEVLKKLKAITTSVEKLQNDLLETLKENTELKVENNLLREKLGKNAADNKQPNKANRETGVESLEAIYHSGFHVCREYYGSHRLQGEDCMFCLDLLYHQSKAKSSK